MISRDDKSNFQSRLSSPVTDDKFETSGKGKSVTTERLSTVDDKNRTEGMTGRSSAKRRTAPCLLALLLLLFFHLSPSSVGGEPIPSEFYGKTSDNDFILLNKLKELFEEKQYVAEREKELDKERMKIQSIIMEGKESEIQSDSDYYAEKLPTPNAVVRQEPQHSGKRTMISYMTLCHFKICNMGRKRQFHK